MQVAFVIFSIFVTAISAQGVAYYDEIKDLPNRPEILLIDVRTTLEIESTGLIPTSIAIYCENA